MGKSYRPYLPEQDFLLPPSLREWLPEHHLVYFVSDVIDNLNLSALDAVYGDEQRGQTPYDPRMMTKPGFPLSKWANDVLETCKAIDRRGFGRDQGGAEVERRWVRRKIGPFSSRSIAR